MEEEINFDGQQPSGWNLGGHYDKISRRFSFQFRLICRHADFRITEYREPDIRVAKMHF
jgi:hypothetical protein